MRNAFALKGLAGLAGSLALAVVLAGPVQAEECAVPADVAIPADGKSATQDDYDATKAAVLGYFDASKAYRVCLEAKLSQCDSGWLQDEDPEVADAKYNACKKKLQKLDDRNVAKIYESVITDYNKDVEARQDLAAEWNSFSSDFRAAHGE